MEHGGGNGSSALACHALSLPAAEGMAAATDEALLAAAGGLSAGLVAEGPLRRFSLGLDLRRFEAAPRLPLNLASVVLELELPQELAGGC